MKIVFASNNTHKLTEVRGILPSHITVLSLRDIGFCDDIDETGTTLEANSLLKAETIWQWLAQQSLTKTVDAVIADDTGLEITALGGQPGVFSARWAGEPADDARNRQKALSELLGVADRSARFRTVITWIDQKRVQQVEGIVEGQMTKEEKGEEGFGYDSLFIPHGYDATFAMLPAEKKNAISHRARALQALCTTVISKIGE